MISFSYAETELLGIFKIFKDFEDIINYIRRQKVGVKVRIGSISSIVCYFDEIPFTILFCIQRKISVIDHFAHADTCTPRVPIFISTQEKCVVFQRM